MQQRARGGQRALCACACSAGWAGGWVHGGVSLYMCQHSFFVSIVFCVLQLYLVVVSPPRYEYICIPRKNGKIKYLKKEKEGVCGTQVCF